MATSDSCTFGINPEKLVADLLADESYIEEDEEETNSEIISPIYCCHESRYLFCKSCVAEICSFCAAQMHMNHQVVTCYEAFTKAINARHNLLVEYNNILAKIDCTGRFVQSMMDDLMNEFFGPLKLAVRLRRSENIDALQVHQQELLQARKNAMQTTHSLQHETVCGIPNQLIMNEKALTELCFYRLAINKASKAVNDLKFALVQTDYVIPNYFINNQLPMPINRSDAVLGDIATSDISFIQPDLTESTLHEAFAHLNIESVSNDRLLSDNTDIGYCSDKSNSKDSNASSPIPSMEVYNPIKILKRGESL